MAKEIKRELAYTEEFPDIVAEPRRVMMMTFGTVFTALPFLVVGDYDRETIAFDSGKGSVESKDFES